MFVTFEGLDGSGKSTQAELLAEHLRGLGREAVLTREPGGTELGERVRELVLAGPEVSPWAEAALFAAARAELVALVIRPALDRGDEVICDRYLDSSLAYQGIARGLGVGRVLELNRPAISDLLPDLTFLLLVDPEVAVQRAGADPDRIEREGTAFLAEVDQAYRELAGAFAGRIVALDGSRPPSEIADRVAEQVRQRS